MKKLLTILIALVVVFALSACKPTVEPPVENVEPVLAGVTDVNLTIGDDFDELDGVTATDDEDGDITASITVSGTVNLDEVGSYVLTYSVTDSADATVTASRTVNVSDLDVVYPTGFFNYKFADTELRHTFMAAAEKYLMNNMAGGIPLFASGSFNLYSSRLQLPVDEYVAVMGFGTAFATMSADDSTVLMDDGNPGNAGEYTYRTTVGANPGTFNQWLYDTSTDSTLMGNYYDALYVYEFNADKTGYEVNPSMAASNPVPQNATVTETGKTVATTWQITLRDDLVWYFHPDTDAAFLATNPDTVIDANDFIDTFKLALDEQWFRAISGGGDFLNSSTGIAGAQDYVDGTGDWASVGLKVVDDLTMEFTFVNEQSEWNVRYFLSSFVMTPINLEMYNYFEGQLTEGEINPYGTNETNVAYHGAYYVSYYEADKIVRMRENVNYHSPDDFFFTGYDFSVITDATIIFNEFIAGKLEATGLPTAEVENYEDHPGLRKVPGATTYRIMINGLGTEEAQREQFPEGSWIPEPLLANVDFKMAMYFAIDRQTLAEDILKVRTTNMFLFSDAYLVDPELGVPYRFTEQGISVGEGLSPDTYGYNFDAARALFLSAIEDLVAAGAYTPGTADNYNTIVIELNNYSDSESWDLACAYFKTAFEEAFVDDTNYINVQVDIYTKDFPAIYYDYMMIGEFDMSVGGISGSTLDAASFLDTYCSDNRGGFTLNWGIDTTQAEIEVIYYDFEGNRHREMWSFDAITSVLNGEVYVVDGEETDVPAAKDIEITQTTVDFTIDQYSNVSYQDITYTIQWYSIDDDAYYDLDGYTNLVPTGADVSVTGLDPYFYGYDADGNILYKGDYQIVVNFVYADDTTKSGSTVSSWFPMLELIELNSKTPSLNGAVLDLVVLSDDYARAISDIVLFEEQSDGSMLELTTATVDFSDLSAIAIGGLASETWYVAEIQFDDGLAHWVWFTTESLVVFGDVTVTDTTATFGVTVDDESSAVVTGIVVYLASDDSVVGTVDLSDLTAVAVSGLAAETDYYAVVTLDSGDTATVEFTTDATPAS